jgi:trigger factor
MKKKAAKKPTAKKAAAKPPAARKATAKPAARKNEADSRPTEPSSPPGIGWPPFRYPPQ